MVSNLFMARECEACSHRRPVRNAAADHATCQLLLDLTGLSDEQFGRVPRAACKACCEYSSPSTVHLNPIVASLLFDLTNRLVDAADNGGELERWRRLRGWAEENLFLGAEPDPIRALGRDRPRRVPREPRHRRSGQPPRLGLIGSNVPSGLGSLNRSLARHLPIERWLVLPHPVHRELAPVGTCRRWRGTDPEVVRSFLDGLDWLLFCEQPQHGSIVAMAHEHGVRVACVPMWEHLDEFARWLRQVDLMICPTRYCHEWLGHWRERLGLPCELALVSWPIDLERFPFQQRRTCQRFLFIHGRGGLQPLGARSDDGDGRKGLAIIREAARLAPGASIIVQTQLKQLPPMPGNVEVRHADLDDQAALYQGGDVCIQPSRWEGLGLPLLECQAVGLPLITTDAPPMNEHRPWRTLPASPTRAYLTQNRPITIHTVDPADLARLLLEVQGAEISEASLAARQYVEREHSWATAGSELLELLDHTGLSNSCLRSSESSTTVNRSGEPTG